ncbi:Cof subfamily protein (haloacid dehalogenase superfamily) [Lederbergia galactosidilyticus]|uniref:Cof-type HAD-IIB family hydrolase n=1 Tax=Lederbergia galactosidilytica TaxID=217031 RepID=UPI001AE6226C|nr:Cof-type HAD-IIB family hydrolase [Lederbergia galactosidilytica]MBP1915587.1 Cof subfamily protein (haloacid dehalogenase superfamily) [Lederbergia galactosidilytica]
MSKIVFFDIDGTLLDENKELPQSTKEAIVSLQEKGVYTALATGRAPFMVEPLLKELGMESYVSFNGQFVMFNSDVIYENPLDPKDLSKLESEARKKGHPIVYMSRSTLKANVDYDQRIEESLGTLHLAHPQFHTDFYWETTIYQALLFVNKQEEAYTEDFTEFDFIRWHENSVDVIPKGGSKAKGIQKLIEKLGFEMEEVYAFGDGLNDIEMLKTVGTGVAMGNALDKVKEVADVVTTNVNQDGIANGLKKVGLL